MNRLYVLYDADCGVCTAARSWCTEQPQMIPLTFVAANSQQAARLFPTLTQIGSVPEELLVVDDRGGVYRGGHAWIMCLYALAEYRELSYRLSSPTLLPLARQAFSYVSKSRGLLSDLLGLRSDQEMAQRFQRTPVVACVPGTFPAQRGSVFAHSEIRDGWTN